MAKQLLFFASVVILGLLAEVHGDDAQHHLNRRSNFGKELYNYDDRSISENLQSCGQNTCGAGAYCIYGGVLPICVCLPGYSGNPLSLCEEPICFDNSDCRSDHACVNQYCVNVCERACGMNTNCVVDNHIPECSCPAGYTGDPMTACTALM